MPNSRHIIYPAAYGWHPLACIAIGMHNVGNAIYALDPTSNSARALIGMGSAVPWMLAIQIFAATVVISQGVCARLRRTRHAYVWWMVLSACALLRFSGSWLSGADGDFQTFLYFFSICVCGFGAWNASRTR